MASYGIPSDLFTLLAAAKAQPDQWARDAGSAGSAMGSIAGAIKGYQDQQRTNKLNQFFDTSVPDETMKRLVPGAPPGMTYRDLGGLSSLGILGNLPDKGADLATAIRLAGRPDLAGIFGDNATDSPVPTSVNPATIGAVKALRNPAAKTPRPVSTSMSPEVQTLKALAAQYTKKLGDDTTSEADRTRIQKNLDAVTARLGRIGGVHLDMTPAPAPNPAAPAPAVGTPAAAQQTTSNAVQALLKALTQ